MFFIIYLPEYLVQNGHPKTIHVSGLDTRNETLAEYPDATWEGISEEEFMVVWKTQGGVYNALFS